MKKIKALIAVLATAALTFVATHTQAADSFAPTTVTNSTPIWVDKTTHVQTFPVSRLRIFGYTTNRLTDVSVTGTNFIVKPDAPFQYITAVADVNLVYSTNTSATTSWRTTLVIDPNGTNRLFTFPSSWKTNAGAVIAGTVTNGTYGIVEVQASGTVVHLLKYTISR